MAARSDRTHVDGHTQILSAVLAISYCTEADTLAAGDADEYAMHATVALEEVIVSARKRDESLQDILVSVSVRSGQELDDRMDFRVQEILRPMPNVTTEVQNPRQTSIAIRGLGRSPANDGLESSVGSSLVADRLAFRLNAFDTDRRGFVHGDTVSLWARNLFDADYYTTLLTAGAFGSGATFGAVADPRTYGRSLKLGF